MDNPFGPDLPTGLTLDEQAMKLLDMLHHSQGTDKALIDYVMRMLMRNGQEYSQLGQYVEYLTECDQGSVRTTYGSGEMMMPYKHPDFAGTSLYSMLAPPLDIESTGEQCEKHFGIFGTTTGITGTDLRTLLNDFDVRVRAKYDASQPTDNLSLMRQRESEHQIDCYDVGYIWLIPAMPGDERYHVHSCAPNVENAVCVGLQHVLNEDRIV